MGTLLEGRWNGIPLRQIAAEIGTPVLVASESHLRENIAALRDGLGAGATLRYCAKTNPDLTLLGIVRAEGTEVLACHAAEVRLAIEAGFPAGSIAYQRPVLDSAELDEVLALGVRRVHAFRDADLSLLASAASRGGVTLRVSLRIASSTRGVLIPGGSRLGFDPRSLNVTPPAGIIIDALNTYIGTQQENPVQYRPAIRQLVRTARRLGTVEELNLGGGIPSRTLRRVTPSRLLLRDPIVPGILLQDYAMSLRRVFDQEGGRSFRLVLEPGRSIVGNAVVLLTRVSASQGRWRFLDCGRNVLVESPLAFTRSVEPIEPRPGRRAFVHLSGPTLNTLDIVDAWRRLPPIATGDVLAIGDSGAYTLSRGTRYAGLGPPMLLVRSDGSVETIRRADTFDDFVAPMRRGPS